MSLLSICIPTYNRSDELKNRLEEILVECYSHNISTEIFEIVISDNCSEDDTRDVVNRFKKDNKFINIKYHKNDKNIGYGKNINKLIQLSTYEYIWLCGDDDNIRDGAIKHLLNILDREKPQYVVLNSINFDLRTKQFSKKNIIDNQNDGYIDSSEVLGKYFEIIVFIGSNVFNRKFALNALSKLNGQVSDVYQNSIISFLIINDIEKVFVSSFAFVNDKLGNKNYTIRQYIDVPILEYIKMKKIVLSYNSQAFLKYLNSKIYKHIKFYFYKVLLWKIFRGIEVKDYYLEVLVEKDFLEKEQILLIKLFIFLSSLNSKLLKSLLFVVLKFNAEKFNKIQEDTLSLKENKITKYMEEK